MGPTPDNLCAKRKTLQHRFLGGNNISSTIPKALMHFSNLQQLDISNYALHGSVLANLDNLGSLSNLYLHNNSLTGTIPPKLGNINILETLSMYHNLLTSAIPPELGNLKVQKNSNFQVSIELKKCVINE